MEVYTTSGVGSYIRDAETGEFYPHLMGSKDEHLYYSIILATGELNSKNGSNVLFYQSPYHYKAHFQRSDDWITKEHLEKWENLREQRLIELEKLNKGKVKIISN